MSLSLCLCVSIACGEGRYRELQSRACGEDSQPPAQLDLCGAVTPSPPTFPLAPPQTEYSSEGLWPAGCPNTLAHSQSRRIELAWFFLLYTHTHTDSSLLSLNAQVFRKSVYQYFLFLRLSGSSDQVLHILRFIYENLSVCTVCIFTATPQYIPGFSI